MHFLALEAAGPHAAAICQLLAGQPVSKVVILSTQLLTSTHSAVLKALKVSYSRELQLQVQAACIKSNVTHLPAVTIFLLLQI